MITEKPQMNGEIGRTYAVSTKSIFVIILKTVAYTNVYCTYFPIDVLKCLKTNLPTFRAVEILGIYLFFYF